MKVKITKVLEGFKGYDGKLMGLYEIEISESISSDGTKFITVNGNHIALLTYFLDRNELVGITSAFRDAILTALRSR